ncbi:hypothetical protein G7Z17_g2573 [Cylindrodendrum hubeiense]|uniref:Amino acid transporter n=1 Tax=Cylindrodendrum hubeiense TaxID=595255 RepID=A0A9P5HGC3_9HYPO|nr:hypothetical protein G7Z17_g2573 [Cylindrodendrum hubeiense]
MEGGNEMILDASVMKLQLQKSDKAWPDNNHSIRDASIKQQKHKINSLSIIALGYNTCNSWIAIASTLAVAIASGGGVTLLYGILFITFIFACTGSTLAELASVYPTAGGQYHFTSILAPARIRKGISYVCGLLAVCSWIAFVTSVTILVSQILLALVAQYNKTFEIKTWHTFCVYIALATATAIYTALALSKTMWIFDVGLVLTLLLFLTVMILCPIRSPSVATTKSVWVDFINGTGWPDSVAFLTGLLTPQFMFLGIDSTLHLAEECENPKKFVPKAIMATVAIDRLGKMHPKLKAPIWSILLNYTVACLIGVLYIVSTTDAVQPPFYQKIENFAYQRL